MQEIFQFFSVNTTAITILSYPMSWVELLGTIFNLWSVWLVTRNRIETWPVGIVGVGLFMVLFYQIRLYSDVAEQAYSLFASVYGWRKWAMGDRVGKPLRIWLSEARVVIFSGLLTAGLTLLLGYFTTRLDVLWPILFPYPASYPYADALTTVMSLTATILMAQKRVECWYYWIAVDCIGIVLYAVKGVIFVALLYCVFLALAVYGLLAWKKEMKEQV